jgi:hypothetical protein
LFAFARDHLYPADQHSSFQSLNRGFEGRKKPRGANLLRQSGSLEHDAERPFRRCHCEDDAFFGQLVAHFGETRRAGTIDQRHGLGIEKETSQLRLRLSGHDPDSGEVLFLKVL